MASELQAVKGVGTKTEEKLNELGISNIFELVCFIPTAYVDLDNIVYLTKDTEPGLGVLFCECIKVAKGGGYGKKEYFKAVCYSGDCLISVTWYNMPYLSSAIIKGGRYKIFGKIFKRNEVFEMINPLFENTETNKKLSGIMPVYRVKGLIPQSTFKNIVNNALAHFTIKSITDLYNKNENSSLKNALFELHNRKKDTDIEANKECIAEDALLAKILSYRILKNQSQPKAHIYDEKYLAKVNDLKKQLPYTLTLTQENALREIISDLNGRHAVNRLLSGDVGSGKTIIALLTAYYAALNGKQVAYLAPTEILANQIYAQFSSLCGDKLEVQLLTASVPAPKQREIAKSLQSGDTTIVVSTTSILSKKIIFKELTYIIIDESHRFGVANRANLQYKGNKTDTLIMTATPIPRSLSMLMYGEMDDSYIVRRDNLGEKINTIVTSDLSLCFMEILKEIAKGRQAYIVCPMIEDNEGCDLFSAKTIYTELTNGIFREKNVGLVYGSQNAKEKSLEMAKFYEGKTDILVSTTVIEVGINCPNATVIVILNSERFGLATLHQLRGRVGRTDYLSKCFLVTKTANNPRLLAFSTCYDGMEIAEIDYELRGAGEYFGLRQSGSGEESYCAIEFSRDSIIKAKEKADKMLLSEDFLRDFKISPHYKNDEILKKITLN